MKYIITFFLIAICTAGSAQTRNMTRGVHDDGKTLRLTYNMTEEDKYVDYEKSFDVQGWTKAQRDALVNRIIDSLNNAPSTQKKDIKGNKSVKINDNGTQLTLIVDYRSGSQNINYTHTYDVRENGSER